MRLAERSRDLKVQVRVVGRRLEACHPIRQERAEAGARFDALVPKLRAVEAIPGNIAQEIQDREVSASRYISQGEVITGESCATVTKPGKVFQMLR